MFGLLSFQKIATTQDKAKGAIIVHTTLICAVTNKADTESSASARVQKIFSLNQITRSENFRAIKCSVLAF
jgi:hypothetical protein